MVHSSGGGLDLLLRATLQPAVLTIYFLTNETKEVNYSGVSTSIKAHNFARLLRGPLSIPVANNSKLGLFQKSRYPERFLQYSRSYKRFGVCHASD